MNRQTALNKGATNALVYIIAFIIATNDILKQIKSAVI